MAEREPAVDGDSTRTKAGPTAPLSGDDLFASPTPSDGGSTSATVSAPPEDASSRGPASPVVAMVPGADAAARTAQKPAAPAADATPAAPAVSGPSTGAPTPDEDGRSEAAAAWAGASAAAGPAFGTPTVAAEPAVAPADEAEPTASDRAPDAPAAVIAESAAATTAGDGTPAPTADTPAPAAPGPAATGSGTAASGGSAAGSAAAGSSTGPAGAASGGSAAAGVTAAVSSAEPGGSAPTGSAAAGSSVGPAGSAAAGSSAAGSPVAGSAAAEASAGAGAGAAAGPGTAGPGGSASGASAAAGSSSGPAGSAPAGSSAGPAAGGAAGTAGVGAVGSSTGAPTQRPAGPVSATTGAPTVEPVPAEPAAGPGSADAAAAPASARPVTPGTAPAEPAAAGRAPVGPAATAPASARPTSVEPAAGDPAAAGSGAAAPGTAPATADKAAATADKAAATGGRAAADRSAGAGSGEPWFRTDGEATTVLPAVTRIATAGSAAAATSSPAVNRPVAAAASVDPATVRIRAAADRPTQVIPAAAPASPPATQNRPSITGSPSPARPAGAADAPTVVAAAAAAGPTPEPTGGTAGGPGTDSPPPASPNGQDGDGPNGPDGGDGSPTRRRRRRPLLVAAAVFGLLAVLYVLDLVLGSGTMPRGVSVAGQHVGGLSHEEAEAQLRATIEPRASQAVDVTAGDVRTRIDAAAAGLGVDWGATIERAGVQPLNPVTRITSFFTDRDFDVVSSADDRAIAAALEGLAPLVDKEPTEGTVRFDGLEPDPVMPEDGHRLDVAAAVPVVETQWARGGPIELPLAVLHPTTTADDVRQVVDSVARPAVSAPVTVTGEGAQGTLEPADIAKALTFRADGAATPRLVPELNPDVVSDALAPQLASTEKPGRDATLDVSGPTPVVVPSQDGRGIDYPATLKAMVPVLTTSAPRQVAAVYGDEPAKVTTEDIEKLGIAGEISTFTTGGFAADSGRNIKRAAEQIDGTIVKPGETFSLNKATNPRNAANGYVEAGIIEDGHPARGVGGGVSQVATTLYNAAYFAGMVDVAHKEHSFYIGRYPVAREATVFDDVIDLRFRNDGPTGVLIKTIWTPSSLTVKIFGTKRYEVTSTTGPRTNEVPPSPVTIPAGQPCSPSQGAPGFTASDTRTLRNIQTGEVRTEKRTVHYNPSPIVICGG